MKLVKGDKLVMIGDSITDCGRRQPIGEGPYDSLGKGYAAMVEAQFTAFHPGMGIRVVNMGISGNTIRELKARWQSDVLDLKPDWLSIMIGINDVWRQFDMPYQKESHIHIEEYENTLEELIKRSKPSLKGLILMTPFFIEPNGSEPMRKRMDSYGDAVKRLAVRHDAVFVNIQAAFNHALEHFHPAKLSGDRIHPNMGGHGIITKAFLKAIEFEYH